MIGRKSATLYIFLALILLAGSLAACNSPEQLPVPQETPEPSIPANTNEPASDEPQDPSANSTEPASRVNVVYFHPKRRCGTCISVETRTKNILENDFKDALDSDLISFQTYELDEVQNASIVKKYGAVSSQLFITTIKNGTENIKHIEEVWMPSILNDGVAFDEFLHELILQSLEEVR